MMTPLTAHVRAYWNSHIHDQDMTVHPIGTPEFFRELDEYRFEKLHYLPKLVDFSDYTGQTLLEVGCGAGIDLVRFARGGANVVGVDLAEVSVLLAKQNFKANQLPGSFMVMDGEQLALADNSFDIVYGHGVLQYTADPETMIDELYRVLRPGGQAIFMVYNRRSWLNFLSTVLKVDIEHVDAPILRKYSISEFEQLLKPFSHSRIVPERFPVPTKLHKGVKGLVYNRFFVQGFNLLPKSLVRPLGWHLMAFAQK